jgi:homoserine dehydrogenase
MAHAQSSEQLIVLKFGSSVLRSAADLPVAVHEIYSELRERRRIVAVVSAFAGVTDRLLAEAKEQGLTGHALADHVGKGEQQTANELAQVLNVAGVPARVADPRDFSGRAEGDALAATPYDLDVASLQEQLRQVPVLVIPGFYAMNAEDNTVLLGRGGSDLTAIYVAHRLGGACRLVKDVDGIYERDPAKAKTLPPRFAHVSWEHAAQVGGKLVQPRSLEFAQKHKQAFAVGAAGNVQTTVVSAGPDTFKALPHDIPPLRVVLLGLGTVGLGVYRYLTQRPDLFDVRRIVVRNPDKPRQCTEPMYAVVPTADGKETPFVVPRSILSTDLQDALNEPAELVIEAIGGIEPAAGIVEAALAKGRAVITANKALIAARWKQLSPYAMGSQRSLRFSSAVGGSVPVLETIETVLQNGDRIERVRGVINGTCNFILDAMAEGKTYAAALKEAQDKGFAEADPRSDVGGEDAAFKLGIIAALGFGAELALDKIERQGIEHITPEDIAAAKSRGAKIRLVATGERAPDGTLRLSVRPQELPLTDFLAGPRNEENHVELRTLRGETIRLAGKGAGRWPTAVAVLGDVYAQLRDARVPTLEARTGS